MTTQTGPLQAPDPGEDVLIPIAPVLEAIFRVTSYSHYAFEHRLTALPDPCPRPQLRDAIVAVLRPLAWKHEGARRIEAALIDLERRGVIPGGDGQEPEPGNAIPEPGEWRPWCQWCGELCWHVSARYCCHAHRQAAYERRRKDKRAGQS